jgi:hypothetical protein
MTDKPLFTIADVLSFLQVYFVDILNATPTTAATLVGILSPFVSVFMIGAEILLKIFAGATGV